MINVEKKLYFCTSNQKDVFIDLQNNPYVELCVSTPNFEWIRISGEAIFIKDEHIKDSVLESSTLVKSIYKTSDNPVFEVFYLKDAKAIISDFSGNPPRVFVL